MDDPTPIRRCVCGDVTFAEMQELGILSLEAAQAIGMAVNCQLCLPYLCRSLRTGEIAFAVDAEVSSES